MTQDRPLLGIGLMLAFCVLAPLLDTASKLATETIPVGQITAARFFVQGALMVPVALLMGYSWRLGRRDAGLLLARAVFLLASTYGFVAGVQVMPIADALAIFFVQPLIVTLLSALTVLALLEHWFMVLPLPDQKLWRWMIPQPRSTHTLTQLTPAHASGIPRPDKPLTVRK